MDMLNYFSRFVPRPSPFLLHGTDRSIDRSIGNIPSRLGFFFFFFRKKSNKFISFKEIIPTVSRVLYRGIVVRYWMVKERGIVLGDGSGGGEREGETVTRGTCRSQWVINWN